MKQKQQPQRVSPEHQTAFAQQLLMAQHCKMSYSTRHISISCKNEKEECLSTSVLVFSSSGPNELSSAEACLHLLARHQQLRPVTFGETLQIYVQK
jgi:hypothetical protein